MTPRRAICFLSVTVLFIMTTTNADQKLDDVAMPADDEWRYLSFEQRHAQMTFLIHPAMMERFQEFYQTPAPELTCETCHGEDAEKARYGLSNSTLDALEPNKVQALYRADAKLSPEQIFKRDTITPLMARLMGVPPYNPASGLGFSCFGCHRREEQQ
jgi:hypothetical protein